MTESVLLDAVRVIAESLKSDLTESITKLDAKCNSIADSVDKMKADEAGRRHKKADENDDDTMAMKTAADSIGAAEFSVLCSQVADLRKAVARPQADLNAFADAQAKADAVMRTHNESACPPMAGEDIVSYQIRQARPMQKHSPRWKGVELSLV